MILCFKLHHSLLETLVWTDLGELFLRITGLQSKTPNFHAK